eukprot:10285865-Alexandrium_andersonii.AAC.1
MGRCPHASATLNRCHGPTGRRRRALPNFWPLQPRPPRGPWPTVRPTARGVAVFEAAPDRC